MLDLRESLQRLSTDTLCRRIWSNELGELRFEIDEFFVKPVVFAIANDWCSFLVIKPVVLADFLAQLRNPFHRLFLFHRYRASYERARAGQRRHCHSERSRGITLHNPAVISRVPSTPLRSAQDDIVML